MFYFAIIYLFLSIFTYFLYNNTIFLRYFNLNCVFILIKLFVGEKKMHNMNKEKLINNIYEASNIYDEIFRRNNQPLSKYNTGKMILYMI